jgi:CBS domain containing-hemolysin-like protein
MSDPQNSGAGGQENGHGAEPREGDSRSGETWIDRLMSAVGLKPSAATLRDTLEDLLERDDGGADSFSADERRMIRNILRLGETRVGDIMIQRAEIAAVAVDVSLTELMIAFKETGHSRMPIYRETLDDASGMVHIRDLMNHIAEEAAVRASSIETRSEETAGIHLTQVDLGRRLSDTGLVRPVLFVPASMPVTDLLARMQSNRIQMALVIDEYGGVDGLVSLEDVVETVVGDIEDEHDIDEEGAAIVPNGTGGWIADGLVELEDFAEATGIDLDAADIPEDVETVGGLVSALVGRMAVSGEQIRSDRLPGYIFEIVAADNRRIRRVHIMPDDPTGRRGDDKGRVGEMGAA